MRHDAYYQLPCSSLLFLRCKLFGRLDAQLLVLHEHLSIDRLVDSMRTTNVALLNR